MVEHQLVPLIYNCIDVCSLFLEAKDSLPDPKGLLSPVQLTKKCVYH